MFKRRGGTALATAAAFAAATLATAPGAVADDAGPWPGTEGKILVDGPLLIDPATGKATEVPNQSGWYAAWAPDGSRLVTAASQISSIRPSGSSKITLPWAEGVRSSASYEDLTFWWGGRYVVFSTGGQLAYGPSDGSWAPHPLLTAAQEPSTVCDNDPTVSPTGLVAFERRKNYGCYDNDGVWVFDSTAKTVKRVLTDAEQPAYSPDGTKLAFVRHVDGGMSQIFTANADGTGVRQITSDARGYANPSWSPTGKRIIFDAHTSGDSSDVHTTEYVDLATGALTKVPADTGGNSGSNPSWQPLRKNGTGRVWGADTYGTNTASSRWTWNTVGESVPGLLDAKAAVLINQDSEAYSLTAPALAGKKHGPVLMTPKSGLSSATKAELKRVLKPGANVYLIGGTSVLSGSVSSQVSALGFTPKRLAGTSRYSTSVAVAKSVTSAPKYVFLATGTDYHSALAAAAAAGADGTSSAGSVVLNDGNKLTDSVKAYLNSLSPKDTMIITVGASAKYALTHTSFSKWPSTYSYYPITASGNEGTSAAVAKFWWSAPSQAALASTDSWRGGVSAGGAMNVFGPVLWTSPGTLSSEAKSYLLRESASTQFVVGFGGSASIAAGALDTAGASISASSSQFVYHPYYKGVVPTSAQRSTFTLRTNGGQAATVVRSGPVGAEPNLAPLKTVHHQ
ncbi:MULTISPECIES: cell wall-binding repeat-containing protein [unclassified Streptomyces]|uniref:cell wall-binding repeat-containing protein n=1 Tax=unclassified Streptomyces TaxID=2593676 RepID=UPI0022584A82|nr:MULTISPECIES: cell wall-binding repeat-containing protein [unclassified Streptomyces]MCX4989025.1 cell wall-binding repeat-containing protein [Streptomyces sp. NBC_00568]MCX5005754.1 cell wall-binding repeat-containing protein [Streptomyces sp. NBC_00638]